MDHNQDGFTLVELMITMLIFLIVIVMAANVFSTLLGNFKQQSSLAESNIEGIVGLQMLQHDIEQAGFGLPWSLPALRPDGVTATYTEAGAVTTSPGWTDRFFNDGPPYATSGQPTRGADFNTGKSANPPGAIRSGNAYNGGSKGMPSGCSANACSDVLVLKGANIGTSSAVQAWTYITYTGGTTYVFGPVSVDGAGNAIVADNLNDNDRIIVIRPEQGKNQRILMTDTALFSGTGNFYTNFPSPSSTGTPPVYNIDAFSAVASNAAFLPPQDQSSPFMTYIVYGIMPAPSPYVATTVPRRPFNEAYYYIRQPDTMPSKCESSTGILYKAVLSNSTAVPLDGNGGTATVSELPLLDCVADMQIVFALDVLSNGVISYTDDISTLNAAAIRAQLKEVRVYIVAHEGQLDRSYTYVNPDTTVCTGADQVCINDVNGIGFIKAFTVPSRNYRWKLYSMIVTPNNLR